MKKFWAAFVLLLLVPRPSAAQSTGGTPNVSCDIPGQVVNETGLVTIGGIQQWIVIEGQDCANPVVLIVHGGPGNPNSPFAHNMFGSWARDFTVVQWDQRGSGKTYAANKPADGESLTMDRLTRDGIDVARYAARHLGKRKVILMGGSWGSALAVHMAMAAPGLFHAYVGTAQLVNYQDDIAASYAHALKFAHTAGDADAITALDKIGSPPWIDPHNFGILRRITRRYEAMHTDPAPKGWLDFAPGYDTADYLAAYEAGEDYSFLQFVGLAGDGMGPKIDLKKLGMHFAMPVYLLQGEEDLVTPAEISKAYFDGLSAPAKAFLVLPRTGHDPNVTMIDAQLRVLTSLVRSAAMTADQP
ncbi:alpha/beta fold hydrolase [Sphingomonas sp. 28-63-12]|uniref:alpha/beta fold hydrolase n=1 Tax=Sphingomonas sp. 28-63-12 TaxID=1970434 RepID=UPI000BC8F030|nr:MAG: proline iminopeptidase [Sphingomonas sp. 28-63-12]